MSFFVEILDPDYQNINKFHENLLVMTNKKKFYLIQQNLKTNYRLETNQQNRKFNLPFNIANIYDKK